MNRKVLFCTPFTSSFTLPVHKALIRQGFDTKIFDYQKGNLISRSLGFTLNLLELRSTSLHRSINEYVNKQLIQAISRWKPDIVFVIKGAEITAKTLKQIRKSKIVLINWYPDAMDYWEWIKNYSLYYDYFFNMVYDVELALKKLHPHTTFIPPASDPDEEISTNRDFPITFVGQYSHRRENYFSEIKDLGLKIWGYKGWQSSTLKNVAAPKVSNKMCLNILRHSKIAVNILSGDDDYEPMVINLRTFEALGTKTFLLVQDHPLLHRYFKPGKDFITFTTPEDLRIKTLYYLQHEKEKENIALHGWNTVKKYHTYDIRLKELFKHVSL